MPLLAGQIGATLSSNPTVVLENGRVSLAQQQTSLLRYLFVLALLVSGLILGVSPLLAQSSSEMTLTKRAEPDTLFVGDPTVLTLQLEGNNLAVCAGPRVPANVVLVIDVSGSMDDDGKLLAAQDAAHQFVQSMDLSIDQVAIVTFSDEATTHLPLFQDETTILQTINRIEPISGTNIRAGLLEAAEVLNNVPQRSAAVPYVILLSDGIGDYTTTIAAAETLINRGVRIFSISLGNDAYQELMTDVASAPSDYFHAPTPDELRSIYQQIAGQISQPVATDIVISITVHEQLEIIESTLQPAGTVTGNQIVWRLPSLAKAETTTFSTELRSTAVGSIPAITNTRIDYLSCGITPSLLTDNSSPILNVRPGQAPASPSACEVDPLSHECLNARFCFGPIAALCERTGLPGWFFPLFLLQSVGVLLITAAWYRKRNKHKQIDPLRVDNPQPPLSPERVEPQVAAAPNLLSVTPIQPLEPPTATLIIGVGQSGREIIATFEETVRESLSAIPENVQLLVIDTGPDTELSDESCLLYLPQDQNVAKMLDQLREHPERYPHLTSWFTPPVPGQHASEDAFLDGRALARLTLFSHKQQVQQRIAKELAQLNVEQDQRVEVFLATSMADPVGSGLLLDVAHLVRHQAEQRDLAFAAHCLALLPEANLDTTVNQPRQSWLRSMAFALWRELNRFQLVFGQPYAINYGHEQTKRTGRLFERCYLIEGGQTERSALLNTPPDKGLYPAIADFLLALLDVPVRKTWEQLYSSVDSRLVDQQVLRQFPLYNSLGAYTYVLPINALVEMAAIKTLMELIADQQQEPDFDPVNAIVSYLARPGSAEMPNTELIQRLAQMIQLSDEELESEVSEIRLSFLGSLLTTTTPTEQQWQFMDPLTHGRLVRSVSTSHETGALDEARDNVTRFLPQIAVAKIGPVWSVLDEINALIEQYIISTPAAFKLPEETLPHIQEWLRKCAEVHSQTFSDRLHVKLDDMLTYDPDYPHRTGVGPTYVFLQTLEGAVERLQHAFTHALENLQKRAKENRKRIDDILAAMQAAQTAYKRRIGLGRALLIGFLLPTLLLFLLLPLLVPLLDPITLLGGAVIIAVGSLLWIPRRLFAHSDIGQLQAEYRALVEEQVPYEMEAYIYQLLIDLFTEMRESVQRPLASLEAWLNTLQDLQTMLEARQEAGKAARRRRSEIKVRRYLEDEKIEKLLKEGYLHRDTLVDALTRVKWSLHEDNVWRPTVYGSQRHDLEPSSTEAVQAALFDLTYAYASELRNARVADILPKVETAGAVAEYGGPAAAPFIHLRMYAQPDIEHYQLVSVSGVNHETYFRTVRDRLRLPAANRYQHELEYRASHRYRCTILSTADLIDTAGLPAWERAETAYRERRGRGRLHVFPAETHATRWEAALNRLNLPLEFFTPYTCLGLEDSDRARAFWWAYGLGWMREDEYLEQRQPQRAWVLDISGHDMTPLTRRSEEAPSLWEAFVNFVLRQENLATIVYQALRAHVSADRRSRRAAADELDKVITRYDADPKEISPADPEPLARDLAHLMRLALEDLNRRLYDETPLLTWLNDPLQDSTDKNK